MSQLKDVLFVNLPAICPDSGDSQKQLFDLAEMQDLKYIVEKTGADVMVTVSERHSQVTAVTAALILSAEFREAGVVFLGDMEAKEKYKHLYENHPLMEEAGALGGQILMMIESTKTQLDDLIPKPHFEVNRWAVLDNNPMPYLHKLNSLKVHPEFKRRLILTPEAIGGKPGLTAENVEQAIAVFENSTPKGATERINKALRHQVVSGTKINPIFLPKN